MDKGIMCWKELFYC